MKEEFNLEQVLGKLAKALNDNQYRDTFKDAIKKLMPYTGNPDIVEVVTSSIDIAVKKSGGQMGLYLLDELLGEMKTPQSSGEKEILGWLSVKWQRTLDAVTADQPASALNYLTSSARDRTDEQHPPAWLLLERWSKLFDKVIESADAGEKPYELRSSLSLDNIKNPAFRREVVKKLDALKDSDSDIVFQITSDTLTRGSFYGFKDNDQHSAWHMLRILTVLLEKKKDTLAEDKLEEISWRVFVNSESDPATTARAGRIYLDLAPKKDPRHAFDMYRSVFGRKNLGFEDTGTPFPRRSQDVENLRIEAANKALDLVDAGKLANSPNGEDVFRSVVEEFFQLSTQKETRNDKIAARAATTIYPFVSAGLNDVSGGRVSYQVYNTAVSLIEYLPKTDPRRTELVKDWKASLLSNVKTGHDKEYYARQMGWMLDVAAKKGDKELAAYTRNEWLESVEIIAQKRPMDAYKLVREVVVNMRYHNPQSALLKDAEEILPGLETRAGIIRTPDEVSLADIKKILAAKQQPKATP